MREILNCEMLFYCGIAVMAAAAVLTVVCLVLFHVTGRKIKKKLTAEFGEEKN